MKRIRQEQTINHALAKSYLSYFLASLIGLLADQFIRVSFDVPYARVLAIIFLGLGPLLMLWAQLTSRKHSAEAAIGTDGYFLRGPYRIVRNPTHLGLLILVTGYTLISGSVIFFGITLIGYLVSNIFFSKYESLLERTYPEGYESYRTRTPKI